VLIATLVSGASKEAEVVKLQVVKLTSISVAVGLWAWRINVCGGRKRETVLVLVTIFVLGPLSLLSKQAKQFLCHVEKKI